MNPQALGHLAIYIVLVVVIAAALIWAIDTLAPEPLRQILRVAVILIALIIIVLQLFGMLSI